MMTTLPEGASPEQIRAVLHRFPLHTDLFKVGALCGELQMTPRQAWKALWKYRKHLMN
jgi:hypothetical protein